MTDSITARLIAALPESLWPEAVRRLRLVPELWALAENDDVLRALAEHARTAAPAPAPSAATRPANRLVLEDPAAAWRPGPLALAAFPVVLGDCDGPAEAWLMGPGRDRMAAAYALLTTGTADLQPIDDAVPAALALQLRLSATADWAVLAAEAAANPERWRLVLQCLWGLMPEGHDRFFAALAKAGRSGARLAAQVLAANLSPDDAVEFVALLALDLPGRQWLALALALGEVGEAAAAHAILRPHAETAAHALAEEAAAAKSLPPAWDPLEVDINFELERSLMVAATEDFALAHPVLTAAWNQIRQLRATVAAHLGRLALKAGDLLVAHAAYQEAYDERPQEPAVRAGLADVLVRLNRAEEALALLEGADELPASAHLITAQAHISLAQAEQARDALLPLLSVAPGEAEPAVFETAANLFAEMGDAIAASRLTVKAAQSARGDAGLHLAAARGLLARGEADEAREAAAAAAALAPDSAEVRETLGRALLAAGRAAEAIPHFKAAAAFEPKRRSSTLGLSQAALEAGQPALAGEAARALLDGLAEAKSPGEQELVGEAHTLLGQALSRQGDDEAAFEHFRRASTLVPTAPEPWRAMARHYAHRGDAEQALATLEAGRQALALVASSKTAPLLADLAEAYVEAQRPTEAILALREACAADPHSHAVHRRLGMLLRQQGSTGEAVEVFRKALALRPGDGVTLHEMGQALEKSGRAEEAWSAYQQAILSRPAEAEPYLNLGRLTLALCRKGVSSASPMQAIAALRSAIERAPDAPEAHGLLAQAQQLAGDAQGALESYQRALRLAPMRTDWSLGLGQVCLALKQPQIAVAALQEALEHAPDNAEVHGALARAYAESGLWPEARRTAEAALRLEPENPQFMQLLAEAAAHLGDMDKALEAWRQAVALNPRDAQMQVRFARCLLDVGQADEARAVFAQALAIAPDSAAVHLSAGLALLGLGEIEQAFQVLSDAVALAPHNAEVQAAFGKAASRAQKHDLAHAAYLQAAENDSGRQRAHYLREAGEALWAMNRPAAAIALWQRAIGLDPHDAGLRSRLGLALLQQGQNDEAFAMLEQAFADSPRDGVLAREAARAARAVGKLDTAAEYLQQAIDLSPNDAEARYMLGQVRDQQGQPEAALSLYRQAARINPGDGRFLAATAHTLAQLGKLDDAVKVTEAALKTSPEDPEVLQQAGELYLRVKRPADAVRTLRPCVEARPRDPAAHLAYARALIQAAESQECYSRAKLKGAGGPLPDDVPNEIATALQNAAALGGDPLAVRYWLARAKAAAGDPREAQRVLESAAIDAVEAGPMSNLPELYRALGTALRKAGQLDRAREAVHAALQRGGEVAPACVELGLIEWEAGDRAAAANAFRRAVAAAPDEAVAHYHLAESLHAMGEAGEATQVLKRALALQPGAAAWHYRLAKIHQLQREHGVADAGAAALAHFQRACELEPDNAAYAADLGRALARDGDLAAAARHFEQATQANPDDAGLWTELGQIELALGQTEAAGKSFSRALALAPASVPALRGAARVHLAEGDLHAAALRAEAAVRALPDDPEALLCLADVASARGETAVAEKHYQAAAEQAAQPGPALLALGRLYAAQQRWDKALDTLERATQASPDSDEAFAALGEAAYAAGNPAAAVKAFREANRIAPRNAKHLLWLGRACRAHGHLDQALSHLMQAREMAPSDDEVVREVGLVFEHRKQYDRALDMYKLAIEIAPKSSANYTRAGVALRHLKHYGDAVIALERAVALDSKNLEATKQLAVVSAMNLVQGGARQAAQPAKV